MRDPALPEDFFDYNEITEEHREAAAEVLKYLDERNGVPEYLASRLKVKFGLKDAEKHNVKNSVFYNLAQQYGLFCVESGTLTDEDGSLVPILKLESDIHRLDEFLEFARTILNGEKDSSEDLEESQEDSE